MSGASSTPAPPEAAGYLTIRGEPALCRLRSPRDAATGTAVLLCPPFGWDGMCSYRPRRSWALDLARRGHHALAIELPGTGSSGGGPDLPQLVPAWVEAVEHAAAWLREATGAARVVAAGIGLGGLLAWSAAADGAAIDELVLWAVPGRGRALLRELRTFARLEDGPRDEDEGPADGGLLSGGFRMSAETVAAIERLDVAELPLPAAAGRRLLLLGRDAIAVDRGLVEAARRAGADVTVADGPGYGAMMVKPQVSRPPLAVFERVAVWLADAPAPATAPARPAAPARLAPSAALVAGGAPLRERPLEVAQPFGRLAGVLCEPAGAADRAPLCAVLLNAGAQRSIGPNRMWVEIARRWAARGVATLRLDVAGIGDADGETICSEDDGVLYAPRFVGQVTAALDALAERGLPPRFLLGGLCSGAYWAFHAARADERVAALAMLNPRALVWDARLELARDARKLRKLGQARTWRKIARRDASLTSPLVIARALVRRPFAPNGAGEAVRALPAMLDELRERDVAVGLAFSGSEPLQDELERAGLLAQAPRWPNLALEQLAHGPEAHTLRPCALQRRAHAFADGVLDRELARAATLATPEA